MLVLSRRENERIKLGDSIVLTVVRVSRDKVRLGIEAPSDMLVLREELEVAPGTGMGAIAAPITEAHAEACTDAGEMPAAG